MDGPQGVPHGPGSDGCSWCVPPVPHIPPSLPKLVWSLVVAPRAGRKGALSRMTLSFHVCAVVFMPLPRPPSRRVKDLQQQETTPARRWAFLCLSFPLWSSTKPGVQRVAGGQ